MIDCKSKASTALRGPTQSRGYIVVFDAGSSGTRVHIYNFLPHYTSSAVPNIDRCVNNVQTLKQKPGLSNIAEEYSPSEIPKYVSKAITPLLDFARGFIPESQWDSTPLVLKATAGLRAVEPSKADQVITAVADIFRRSGFMFSTNWASIIPGVEEGGLAWVTANYLAGTFDHEGPSTNDNAGSLGIIEMGGGSTQVSFRMHDLDSFNHLDEDKSRPKRQFLYTDLSGRRHNIYALSYLGFGEDHAQKRLANYIDNEAAETAKKAAAAKTVAKTAAVETTAAAGSSHDGESSIGTDPCYRRSYSRTTKESTNVIVKGSGDFQLCKQKVRNILFNVTLPNQPPLIPGYQTHKGYVQPPLTGKFIATENFWYGRRSSDIVPPADLSLASVDVDSLGERFCGVASDTYIANDNSNFDERNRYCFGLAFQSVLLESLHAEGEELPTISKNIGGSDLDWAMGAAVVHYSTHDVQLKKAWAKHGWDLKIGKPPRNSWWGGGGGGGGGGKAGGGIITTTSKLGSILFDRPLTVTMLMFVVIGAVYYWLKNSRKQGGRRKSYVSVIRRENKHV